MNRLFREPLLHFAVAGGILFALHSQMAPPVSDSEPVRIGAAELHWLEQTWTRQWRRPPSPQELHGLVVELLKEELLSREARELGLDRDDTVVRRRLAQKVDFVIRDTTRLAAPSDEVLRRYHADHSHDFLSPERLTFEQILFSSSRRSDCAGDAKRELGAIASELAVDVGTRGDASLLPGSIEDFDEKTIAGQFGDDFARGVLAALDGKWSGPIESPFGAHLVRVTRREAARPRSFEETRDEVAAAWRSERESEAAAAYFQELLQRHPVVVDDETAAIVADIDGARLQKSTAAVEEASR